VQRVLCGRERDIHDRVVENHHQLRDTEYP
jgi:hypothetical protein